MAIAALICWLITTAGGLIMVRGWLARGGMRGGTTRLPAPLVFGHLGIADLGLLLWIIYLFVDSDALAWIAFILLVPVAVLGLTMLTRWLPTHRAATQSGGDASQVPAERSFPVPVVVGHGVFAVVTVILVLLAAAGVGGS